MQSAWDDPVSAPIVQALRTYKWYGNDALLDYALREASEALARPSTSSAGHVWTVLRAWGLRLRFERDGHRADVAESRHLLEPLAQAIDVDNSVRLQATFQLAQAHNALFLGHGEMSSLLAARPLYEHALELCHSTPGQPDDLRDEILFRHALALGVLAQNLPSERKYKQMKDELEGIISRRHQGDPLRGTAISALGSTYRLLYLATGKSNPHYLNECIRLGRESVIQCAGLRTAPQAYMKLCLALRVSYSQGGSEDILREAVDMGEEFAARVLKSRWLQAADRQELVNLGNTWCALGIMDGTLESLQKAVHYQRIATAGFTYDARGYPYAMMCVALCSTLFKLAELAGGAKIMDECIKVGYEALHHVPEHAPRRAIVLDHLGTAHSLRYTQEGCDTDFSRAISFLEEAAACCSSGIIMRHRLGQINRYLSLTYGKRYQFNAQIEDLNHAIEYGWKATSVETHDFLRPYALSEQGERLVARFEVTGSREDLEKSTACIKKALELAVNTRHNRNVLLRRYARTLRRQYEASGEARYIEDAIRYMTEAIDLHQGRPYIQRTPDLTELADALQARYTRNGSQDDLEAALRNYRLASEDRTATYKDRADAALAGAKAAYKGSRPLECAKFYSDAVCSFVPRLPQLGHNTRLHLKRLRSSVGQLACDAAASHIAIGQPERAVELLDEGRSVFWQSVMRLRKDIRELRKENPVLADEIVGIAEELSYYEVEVPRARPEEEEERSQRRRLISERGYKILAAAQKTEGHEGLLLPLKYSKLRQAAAEGPIIIINASVYRTDALIVSATQPLRLIPLSDLPYEVITMMACMWQKTLKGTVDAKTSAAAEQVLRGICRQLWVGGFNKIAEALQEHFGPVSQTKPRRIWWMPTGFMTFLPVHCATSFEPGEPGMCDLFVPSYTGTLAVLINGRERYQRRDPNLPFSMLAVAPGSVEGLATLNYAEKEVQAIAASPMGKQLTTVSGKEVTLARLLKEIPSHTWLHCCCHGYFDPSNPLDSGFRLQDGDLTLSSISSLNLPQADFAFLSSCHTMKNSSTVPDENMHLVAGMRATGFCGTLGTCWAMADRDGPLLATLFYGYLTRDGAMPDPAEAAYALHYALQQFRAHGIPMFRWATFVHAGI